jgi:hypothetical protein
MLQLNFFLSSLTLVSRAATKFFRLHVGLQLSFVQLHVRLQVGIQLIFFPIASSVASEIFSGYKWGWN